MPVLGLQFDSMILRVSFQSKQFYDSIQCRIKHCSTRSTPPHWHGGPLVCAVLQKTQRLPKAIKSTKRYTARTSPLLHLRKPVSKGGKTMRQFSVRESREELPRLVCHSPLHFHATHTPSASNFLPPWSGTSPGPVRSFFPAEGCR